jgi:hypothetical protein
MFTSAMAVTVRSVLVKEAEAEEVDDEAEDSDVEDHFRVVDVLGLVEPLQALDRDGEAECDQEDGVDESAYKIEMFTFREIKWPYCQKILRKIPQFFA